MDSKIHLHSWNTFKFGGSYKKKGVLTPGPTPWNLGGSRGGGLLSVRTCPPFGGSQNFMKREQMLHVLVANIYPAPRFLKSRIRSYGSAPVEVNMRSFLCLFFNA